MHLADIGISLVKVLAVGLALGAGLPAVFALGLRSLSATEPAADGTTRVTTAGRLGAGAAFGVVALAVVVGIVWIVSGGH